MAGRLQSLDSVQPYPSDRFEATWTHAMTKAATAGACTATPGRPVAFSFEAAGGQGGEGGLGLRWLGEGLRCKGVVRVGGELLRAHGSSNGVWMQPTCFGF